MTKLHEASGHSHEKGEHDNRYHRPASEATRYLSLGSSHLGTIMIIVALHALCLSEIAVSDLQLYAGPT